MNRFYAIVGLPCIAALLCAGFVASRIFLAPRQPPGNVEVRVEQGEPLSSVVRKLRDQGVIANEKLFSIWARLSGLEKKVQWGVYRFDLPMSAHEVLKQLVSGKVVFHRVTIPEGFTVKEIAELLGKLQIVDREKFLAEAANPELLALVGLQERGLEGYLFPNTYSFMPSTAERGIILAMTEQFRKVFEPLISQQKTASQLSTHELVTLASIIEKETGIDAERPLIAAVFYNRLRLKMPLQSDPTVIYGIKDFDGNLTRKDLQSPSPYNTYRIAALPPGPICNPGLSSLKAALEPADVPYLYFVSRNDGTHIFSESLEAHTEAVKTYQPKQEPINNRKHLVRRR